ncbi:MAG: aminotransferase class V-fold PLP-dependent enzyme [Candidatus Marinimicrobia bacterium]|nr:aminotransferase class V-fold PLP-dependent enzyme [Candidatus Neomarinimicrobiota bacterium]MCF7829173.1 aminotransferase class V-fold PLP-dependent enzyme [Candidatus Neomarinimicrobiota bacterium]MCF7881174.1 aminotransferase class V-fold PLP-dependent enzyme [Candidatus Neomarinimicrobiota bacterium]
MNPEEARQFFPAVDERLYLNHAASSPFSTRVRDAIAIYHENRTEGTLDDYKQDLKEVKDLRKNLGQLIQGQPDRIALTGNTSHGLNIVAQGFPWKPKDEILYSSMEFPANVYPFLNLKKRGVVVREIPANEGRLKVEDIEEYVTDQTRMLTLSYVQYLNGYRADLRYIGTFCRENNIAFVVDGIQGLGAMPLNVSNLPVDAVATGGHKWLMSPKGTGFIYLTKEFQERLDMTYLGWLSVREPFEFHNYDQPVKGEAARYELGTPNQTGIYGMNAAVQLLLEVGINNISLHILDITEYLRSGLRDAGCEILTPFEDGERAGIVLFSCGNPDENQRIFNALLEKKVTISFRDGTLRVAPHFYNTRADMDRFLELLEEVR